MYYFGYNKNKAKLIYSRRYIIEIKEWRKYYGNKGYYYNGRIKDG